MLGLDDLPLAQGHEGRQLQFQLEAAFQQWCETSSWRAHCEFDDLDEELTYEPIPPKRVRKVRVRYRPVGRGEVMPYRFPEVMDDAR